jgi:hypothetical protein
MIEHHGAQEASSAPASQHYPPVGGGQGKSRWSTIIQVFSAFRFLVPWPVGPEAFNRHESFEGENRTVFLRGLATGGTTRGPGLRRGVWFIEGRGEKRRGWDKQIQAFAGKPAWVFDHASGQSATRSRNHILRNLAVVVRLRGPPGKERILETWNGLERGMCGGMDNGSTHGCLCRITTPRTTACVGWCVIAGVGFLGYGEEQLVSGALPGDGEDIPFRKRVPRPFCYVDVH